MKIQKLFYIIAIVLLVTLWSMWPREESQLKFFPRATDDQVMREAIRSIRTDNQSPNGMRFVPRFPDTQPEVSLPVVKHITNRLNVLPVELSGDTVRVAISNYYWAKATLTIPLPVVSAHEIIMPEDVTPEQEREVFRKKGEALLATREFSSENNRIEEILLLELGLDVYKLFQSFQLEKDREEALIEMKKEDQQ